jgi:Tfp pilus assembly pilus retraction ATPase PilT
MSNPIRKTFEFALKFDASDIHIHSDQKPVLRVDGRLFPLSSEQMVTHPKPETKPETIIDNLLRDNQKEEFARNHQVDIAMNLRLSGLLS